VAVVEDRGVVVGEAARPGVQVEVGMVVELADLLRAGVLLDRVAGADRVAAAAGTILRLEEDHLIAGPVKLVGGGEPGDAGAEDDDALAAAVVLLELRRPGKG
jgi:hypothetical protein